MNDYPPEVQAVLDAALALGEHSVAWISGTGVDVLMDAVAAYRKATTPPEPFEGFVYRHDGNQLARFIHEDLDGFRSDAEIWRCTVTPIERVR